MDASLTQAAIRAALHTKIVGRTLEVHRRIASTNTRAVELARQGASDGTLVLAEEQTAGRGRLGRTWLAPAGSALLFSVVLRPHLAPAEMQRVAMITSLAACRAIEHLHGLQVTVKWPNDLQIEGRKLGGMLCEAGMRGSDLAYVVVGLGLNINLDPAQLGEVAAPAASLAQVMGREVERLPLLVRLLAELESDYDRLNQGWLPHSDWRARLATIGQHVRVSSAEETLAGLAEDVDADGALILRLADGSQRRILAGDVTLRAALL